MKRRSGQFGSTSMGDYDGCEQIDLATYCSTGIKYYTWTGLCLPDSCNTGNVEECYSYSGARQVIETGSMDLIMMDISYNQEYFDEFVHEIIPTNLTAEQIGDIINPYVKAMAGATVASSYSGLMESTMTWKLSEGSYWYCGDNSKWPSVVYYWIVPFILL
eukprot:UN30236